MRINGYDFINHQRRSKEDPARNIQGKTNILRRDEIECRLLIKPNSGIGVLVLSFWKCILYFGLENTYLMLVVMSAAFVVKRRRPNIIC